MAAHCGPLRSRVRPACQVSSSVFRTDPRLSAIFLLSAGCLQQGHLALADHVFKEWPLTTMALFGSIPSDFSRVIQSQGDSTLMTLVDHQCTLSAFCMVVALPFVMHHWRPTTYLLNISHILCPRADACFIISGKAVSRLDVLSFLSKLEAYTTEST